MTDKLRPRDIRKKIGGLGYENDKELVYYEWSDPEKTNRFKNNSFILIMMIIILYTFFAKWVWDQYQIHLSYLYLFLVVFLFAAISTLYFRHKRDLDIMEAAIPFLKLNDRGILAGASWYDWVDLEAVDFVRVEAGDTFGSNDSTLYLVFRQKSHYKDDGKLEIPRSLFSDPTHFMDKVEGYLGYRPQELKEDE